jgi:hypothetical protein
MTAIVIVLTVVICLVGILTSAWSFIDTRKRYFDEYSSRKRVK